MAKKTSKKKTKKDIYDRIQADLLKMRKRKKNWPVSAIIIAEQAADDDGQSVRIRSLDFDGYCGYSVDAGDFNTSCFSHEGPYSLRKTIKKMREYDEEEGIRVVHYSLSYC